MIVHHDAQRLTDDAESYPKDHISNKGPLKNALDPVRDQDHRDLQQNQS